MSGTRTDEHPPNQGVDRAADPVQIDIYGVKVSVQPQALPDAMPDPGSWSDVAKGVHKDLKAIAGGLIRLLRVLVDSTTQFVAGFGALPKSFSKRVEQGHLRADAAEIAAQELGSAEPLEAQLARKKIKQILERKAMQGNTSGLAVDSGDKFIIVYALKPGAEESVPAIAGRAADTLRITSGLVERPASTHPIFAEDPEEAPSSVIVTTNNNGVYIWIEGQCRFKLPGSHLQWRDVGTFLATFGNLRLDDYGRNWVMERVKPLGRIRDINSGDTLPDNSMFVVVRLD